MTARRIRVAGRWIGWLLVVIVLGGTPVRVAAQAAERPALPHTLRDGAPAQRFAGKAPRAKRTEHRPPARPAIEIDRGELLGRAALERRSMALLQREIAVLQRLLVHSRRVDARRADVLLRLAYAYQELMFQQKLRIHQLQETGAQECRCNVSPDPIDSAVAAHISDGSVPSSSCRQPARMSHGT